MESGLRADKDECALEELLSVPESPVKSAAAWGQLRSSHQALEQQIDAMGLRLQLVESIGWQDALLRLKKVEDDVKFVQQASETTLQRLEAVRWQDGMVRLKKLEDDVTHVNQAWQAFHQKEQAASDNTLSSLNLNYESLSSRVKDLDIRMGEHIELQRKHHMCEGHAKSTAKGAGAQSQHSAVKVQSVVPEAVEFKVVSGAVSVVHPENETASDKEIQNGEIYDEVCLSASMWDVPLVMGQRPIHNAAAAMMFFLLLVNILGQALFTAIVVSDMGVKDIKEDVDLLQLQTWRRTIAHDVKFFNDRMQKSLASRVCASDKGLELSNGQADTYSNLKKYLGDGDATLSAIGPILSILSIGTFLLMVSKELMNIMLRLAAVYTIPSGATSILQDCDGLSINQLSVMRKCCFLFVTVVRFVILCFLTVGGSLYLIYTVSLDQLILNCVALEIILNFDDLIFEACAPLHIKKEFDRGPHLAHLKLPRFQGADIWSTGSLLWTLAALAFFIFVYLLPHLSLRVQARDALCAGDQDFLFTVDGAGVPAYTYPEGTTEDYHNKMLEHRNFPDGGSSKRARTVKTEKLQREGNYADLVVDILLQQMGRPYHSSTATCTYGMCYHQVETDLGVHHKERPDAADCCLAQRVAVPQVKPGRFSVLAKSNENVVEGSRLWNPSCEDTLDIDGGYTPMLKNSMGDAVGWESCGGRCPLGKPMCVNGLCIEPKCRDVELHCAESSLAGVRARQLCPRTCKCHEPRSSLVLSLPLEGCGTACYRHGDFRDRLRKLPCQDVEKDDPAWLNYLDQFNRSRLVWPADWRVSSALIIGDLRNFGCRFLESSLGEMGTAYPYSIIFCIESATYYPVKPLSYFCPVACGCRKGDAHCPDSCPSRNDSEPVCSPHVKQLNFPSGTCPMSNGLAGVP